MNECTLCFLTRGSPPQEVLLGFKKAGFGAGKYAGFGGKVEASETFEEAAVRELGEETGLHVSLNDLQAAGRLSFFFPARPEWNQTVYIFLASVWEGEMAESTEMVPDWHLVNQLPFGEMWDDARYWLPGVLRGERIDARIVFRDDNETVAEVKSGVGR